MPDYETFVDVDELTAKLRAITPKVVGVTAGLGWVIVHTDTDLTETEKTAIETALGRRLRKR